MPFQIFSLREVDLIKEYSKWKDVAKQIRNILNQVEGKGFKNLQKWKIYLDKELALVLEKQYINSLDSLHLYLPEIYVDLTYRNLNLEYSPPEEQLKNIYEQQLKRFLDTPLSFRGISDDDTVFKEITERNGEALKNVSKHTNELFDQLRKVIEHWKSWIQLESLDITKLTSWQHWDIHFRASKTFGQETAKLSSTEERVGCFVISLSRLRSDLESHNRSYWDQLIYSLKDSIAQDVVKLQDYINHSTSALTRQPLTIEEIGESGAVHKNILEEAPMVG
ncbi:unnamed protein product [Acanthoscelides obtectus]|uniref:Dynein heavy chain linker domain-containing protein n=1 Tax=Acanthoscelides obtectus TaxID=200917 RepID=A0A9P0KZJ8_ACAOB|nr:unnamed protein product [Acanthoscelides obtectus]CAK1630117.1 Cytoplasmic dynein 2 heavy chain 1 [Acanthoscelides obtectus]